MSFLPVVQLFLSTLGNRFGYMRRLSLLHSKLANLRNPLPENNIEEIYVFASERHMIAVQKSHV